MSERLDSLKRAVETACNCKASHISSTPVKETFRGETVWEGVIETFGLEGHINASRCYAFPFIRDDKPEIKTVLGLPPIDSPHSALRAAIAASVRE